MCKLAESELIVSGEDVVPAGYVDNLFDLRDRVAVVTGGGSGLGAAIAIGYAQAGVKTALLDVNEDGMLATKAIIESQGGVVETFVCDVTSKENLTQVSKEIMEKFSQVDILVNSAGSAFRSPAEDFPEDKLDFILNLNLKGTYLAGQVFGNIMLKQGKGSIINIASIGGFIAYPLASAYLASKGGVVQLTKSFALEWGARGVRVNGIGPTLMDSPLTKKAGVTTSVTADFIKGRMIKERLGLPKELIGAAIFLGSDASLLVNGHTIMCDDGYLIA
ncbi:MAG: SDR family oxidoreductase [Streptomycetaceae bacterium]|nr:MAG: SDR family oxidoreductase [Streptomycetaceae bacterium]